MRSVEKFCVHPQDSIRRVMEILEESALQIALVADNDGRLLGTITDGDIRRGLLGGSLLTDRAESIMAPDPVVAKVSQSEEEILNLALAHDVRQIPVVDEERRVVGVESLHDFFRVEERDNPAVIMAGGLGTRLLPLTRDVPKPLLRVGSKPILRLIIENFAQYGFRTIYICVNYRADQIREHFGTGEDLGVRISYVEENQRLGTAGALSLLRERLLLPFFVMNGDLITNVNFEHLLVYHRRVQAVATMAVKDHGIEVPYGVIRSDRNVISAIEEKPRHNFFVNTGIYVLSPDALDFVPTGEFFDMPMLFHTLSEAGRKTCSFQIRDYWLDIGRPEDLEQAQSEVVKVFDRA